MKKKCVLYGDQDGVFTDFVTGSLIIHGREDLIGNASFPPYYDYWSAMGLTPDQFWQPIREAGPNWWRDLPDYPWSEEVRELFTDLDPLWRITTKPVDAGGCAGKWAWRDLHEPGRTLHITTDKAEFSAPGRLLIDDSDINISTWQALGGDAILFPASWNSLANVADNPLGYVRHELERLGYDATN